MSTSGKGLFRRRPCLDAGGDQQHKTTEEMQGGKIAWVGAAGRVSTKGWSQASLGPANRLNHIGASPEETFFASRACFHRRVCIV